MTSRRALLLDLDGTLADSLPAMRRSYFRLLAGMGRLGSDEEFDAINGPPLAVACDLLRDRHDLDVTVADLLADWLALIEAEYMAVPPADGAAEILAIARERGWRTAVVTSSTTWFARRWLETVGLAGTIDEIVGGDAVDRGKPAPDPYLLALRRLGSDPRASLAVEDSPTGATAALSAGLRTLVLTGTHPGPFPAGSEPISRLAAVLPLVDRE